MGGKVVTFLVRVLFLFEWTTPNVVAFIQNWLHLVTYFRHSFPFTVEQELAGLDRSISRAMAATQPYRCQQPHPRHYHIHLTTLSSPPIASCNMTLYLHHCLPTCHLRPDSPSHTTLWNGYCIILPLAPLALLLITSNLSYMSTRLCWLRVFPPMHLLSHLVLRPPPSQPLLPPLLSLLILRRILPLIRTPLRPPFLLLSPCLL